MSGDKRQEGQRHFGVLWTIVFVAVTAIIGGALALAEEPLALAEEPLALAEEPLAPAVIRDLDDPVASVLEEKVALEQVAAPISAADIMGNNYEPVAVGNIRNLFEDGMIVPPPTNNISTLKAAVDAVVQQVGKTWIQVSTNNLEILDAPYKGLGDGKSTMEWRQVLRYLLNPHGLNFAEDGTMVLIGKSDEVEVKRKIVAQERLTNNWTPISFTANVDEGGTPLRTALLAIAQNAGIYINLDYMDPKDLGIVPKTVGPELTAEDLAAGQQAAAPVETFKRTTFSTPANQTVEWRIVLREVLNPAAYDFIEVDGVVRVASFDKIKAWETEKNNAKPMSARVVQIYHANPETIVERITAMHLLMHPTKASINVTRKSDEKAATYTGGQAGIAMASGTQIGASSIGSGSAFGNLKRPLTPPGVIVYDITENLDTVEKNIKLLDIREKQVLIEALVLDLGDGFDKELGINWTGFNDMQLGSVGFTSGRSLDKGKSSVNYALQENRNSDLATTITPSDTTISRESGDITLSASGEGEYGAQKYYSLREKATAFTGLLGPLNFAAVLKMVENNSDNRVLSSPVLVIGDHSEAVIQVGTAEPIPITTVNYGGDNAGEIGNSIEWQVLMTGVTLWVAPEVTGDGRSVRLSVHPQITNPEGYVTAPDGSKYPNVVTRELDTRVTVPSGDTLILGGLMRTVETESISKIPILGDIPWLGRLFRSRSTSKTKRNLVILIRPTILDDENPDSGFEAPAMKIIEPMMATSGKNLVPPAKDDKMEEREAKILKKFGVKDKVETKTQDETAVENTEEIVDVESADAVKSESDAEPVVDETLTP